MKLIYYKDKLEYQMISNWLISLYISCHSVYMAGKSWLLELEAMKCSIRSASPAMSTSNTTSTTHARHSIHFYNNHVCNLLY